MDVTLLSRMIGELILDNDRLGLPGLGTFVVEDMPASFSDRGYTVSPPYRRLSFVSDVTDDGLLAALYAGSNNLSADDASAILGSFLDGLAEELRATKSVDLPGLGRLRATREGHFFFVASADLDISPDACGLESVSLKSHAVMPQLPDAPAPVVQDAPSSDLTSDRLDIQGAPEHCVAPAPQFTEAGKGSDSAPEKRPAPAKPRKPRKPIPAAARWTFGALAAAALVIGGFAALARLAPDFTDRLLYTPQQLAIINAPEDGTGLPY